jgi:hypothetical protein
MATGVVADLGARDSRVSREAPSNQPIPTALSAAVAEPQNNATVIAGSECLTAHHQQSKQDCHAYHRPGQRKTAGNNDGLTYKLADQ